MFLGHFALSLAVKRAAPRASLGVLTAAGQLADMLWPIFLLLGWEQVRIDPGNTAVTPLAFDRYPLSHSLLMLATWGALLGGLYLMRTRQRVAAACVALLVVSHWGLDWLVHRPDLPLVPWSGHKVGLGLWNSVAATLALEAAMTLAGVWIYVRSTHARDGVGRWALWVYVGALVLIYVGNLAGPPPAETHTLAVFALGLWLFPVWAGWIDRHRAAD